MSGEINMTKHSPDASARRYVNPYYIAKRIRKIMPAYLRLHLPKEIAVVAVTPRESQKLNRKYRKKNKPANVLSFRYGPDASFRDPRAREDYGEILVCTAVIRREAKRHGNAYNVQLTRMIIHGMIHLAGIHHERSGREEKRTKMIEERVLKKFFE